MEKSVACRVRGSCLEGGTRNSAWRMGYLLVTFFCLSTGLVQAQTSFAKGLIFEPEQIYRKFPVAPRHRAFLPAEVDLTRFFPEPGYQGQQSSCTAWAVGYAMRTYYEVRTRGINVRQSSTRLSPAFIYNSLVKGRCDSGTTISDALNVLKDVGVSTLGEFPYALESCARQPSAEVLRHAELFRIEGWHRVDTEHLDDYKGQLSRGHPVVIGMKAPDSFSNLRAEQIFHAPSESGTAHAVVLIGYSDAKSAFKIMNSWGSDWGDHGFGWVSYATILAQVKAAYVIDPLEPISDELPTVQSEPENTKLVAVDISKHDQVDPMPPIKTEVVKDGERIETVHPPVVPLVATQDRIPAPTIANDSLPVPVQVPTPNPVAVVAPPPTPVPNKPNTSKKISGIATPTPQPAPPIAQPPRTHSAGQIVKEVRSILAVPKCAQLSADVTTVKDVSITGFLGDRKDKELILRKIAAIPGIRNLKDETQVFPWPQCEALITFHKPLERPAGLVVRITNETSVLHEGDPLMLEITTPNFPSYLYVTYLATNGEAIHLHSPSTGVPLPVAPNTRLVLGDGKRGLRFRVGAPFGEEMVVVVASASPLFLAKRPARETERDYLTNFRIAFLAKSLSGKRNRIVSAATTALKTEPR